jgi:ubiquinone/menaquinone biosynthesis C-methylase UbiE
MLHAGCQLGLFSLLHREPGSDQAAIARVLGLQPRPARVLLLGTTALGLTIRDGDRYRNAALLDGLFPGSWEIIEDLVEFEARIVLPVGADFIESLRTDTNAGLRRIPGDSADLYHRLSASPGLERLFYRCMRSWSRLSNPVLIENASLTGARRVLDVGGGDGVNSIALATAYPGLSFTVLDMPGALEFARDRITESGLSSRVSVRQGDIFTDPYPDGHDCVLFANQLVIWSPEQNAMLLEKAYHALPEGGRVLIFSAMSDHDGPVYAALDNLYFMTLPTAHSTIYRWDHYEEWLRAAGFAEIERRPGRTWTPHGVISARK